MSAPRFLAQASFAGGEFSPALWGRVDISKYLTGLKTARNVSVMPQGGVRNRPGTALVAAAGNSTEAVRLIPFVASTRQAYVIELGNYYARFYTQDAQVALSASAAWATGTPYAVGNFVSSGGLIYYCLVAHTSGTFATDLASGKWVQQSVYQIPTPWAAADIFNLKFAQSADVMYFAHPSYAPQTMTFNSSANWVLAAYSFLDGPFMVQNTTQNSTITPSGTVIGKGTPTGISSMTILADGRIQLSTSSAHSLATGEVIQISSTFACTGLAAAYAVPIIAGQQFAANVIDSKTFQLYVKGTTTVVKVDCPLSWLSGAFFPGAQGFYVNMSYPGLVRAVSSGTWSGSAVVCIYSYWGGVVGDTSYTFTSAGQASASVMYDPRGVQFPAGITGAWSGVLTFQTSDDGGVTWRDLSTAASTNLPETDTPSGGTVIPLSLITLTASAPIFNAQHINALFQLIDTIDSSTSTMTFTASGQTGGSEAVAAMQCGHDWSIITSGSWIGILSIQVSVDGGKTWTTIQTLQSTASNTNYTTSGDTGFDQCLIQIVSSGTWSGTATVTLTVSSFDWVGVVQVAGFTDSQHVTANILPIGANNTGLANTSAIWQWSEGSWSTYRGWPSCVSFYQDRLCWASTPAEIETIWLSKTSSYNDFGISEPIQADDGFSIVLPSRSLNAVSTLIVMPQFMVALTSDSEWAISPGNDGILSSTSVNVQLQGHRGSSSIDPVVVGIELILMQQMGTVVRNLIFQLAVNGFFGDNISIVSQHLFTGYQIAQMAYQQEPDSIVWLVRNDGQLLSMTYMRDQEMMAWTHHDTAGTFESVCTIPNQALGINETWFVVNRNGTRYIERLMPRDQGTSPAQQFFVDCGIRTTFGSPTKAITGLPYPDGTALAVLADGCVVPGMVCNSGGFTLPVASTVVTVGLPYISDIETLRIESPDQRGATQGRKSLIPKVTVRLWNSRGGYFSCTIPSDSSTTNMDPFRQRSASDNFNAPIPLKTEDYTVTPRGQYTEDGHICIRQVDPLPFCLLGVFPSFVAGEK